MTPYLIPIIVIGVMAAIVLVLLLLETLVFAFLDARRARRVPPRIEHAWTWNPEWEWDDGRR